MSWFQLLDILKQRVSEREYWASTQPYACPQCGEPLRAGPPESERILYCPYDGWTYPRDWTRPAL